MQFHTQKSKNLSEMKDLLFQGVFFKFFSDEDFQCAETVYNNNWAKKKSLGNYWHELSGP